MIAKITKRSVDALRPAAADQFLWDEELKGFGLKVTPAGRKVFLYQFRSPVSGRARRRVTIGAHGSITADQARSIAKQLAGRVAQGEDPAMEAQSRVEAAAATVDRLSTEYLGERKVADRTLHEIRRHFRLHILPKLGKKPVALVTAADVVRLHAGVAKASGDGERRGGPIIANRVLATVSAFMNWCERRGYRERGGNPCADVERFPEQSRERFLTVAEIARLSEALRTAERQGLPTPPTLRKKPKKPEHRKHVPKSLGPIPANPHAVAAIRFLLLTGWREQEALTLEWSHVDKERGLATLPKTKTGKSHRPLGAPALALLEELPRLKGNPYVFPGVQRGERLKEIRRVWYAARHAAGLDDVRLHDLRHTVASFAVGTGHSLVLTGSLLGHASPATTKRYAHLHDDARRATADTVSGAIAAAMMPRDGEAVAALQPSKATRRKKA